MAEVLPVNEFLLWNNCNNNCKFCWQKKDKQSSKDERLESIQLVYEAVHDLTNSHVLFVGGEIFSEKDEDVKEGLFKLFELTFNKMEKNELDLCYINTNILYNINDILLPVLKEIEKRNLGKRVHFTTSADHYGRFNDTESLFYDNLKLIRENFKDLYIICNIILTKPFCDDVLNNKFNIKEYKEKYDVDVNTIPYIKYGTVIGAPTREEVFSTLMHLEEQDPGYLEKYCNNFLLNQQIILRQYKDHKLQFVSADKSPCTHSENFKRCYADSDECFVCDCAKLKDLVKGR